MGTEDAESGRMREQRRVPKSTPTAVVFCDCLPTAPVGAGADPLATNRDECYQAGLPASRSSDSPDLPATNAGAWLQWLLWDIVTRYGGATALDLSAAKQTHEVPYSS